MLPVGNRVRVVSPPCRYDERLDRLVAMEMPVCVGAVGTVVEHFKNGLISVHLDGADYAKWPYAREIYYFEYELEALEAQGSGLGGSTP